MLKQSVNKPAGHMTSGVIYLTGKPSVRRTVRPYSQSFMQMTHSCSSDQTTWRDKRTRSSSLSPSERYKSISEKHWRGQLTFKPSFSSVHFRLMIVPVRNLRRTPSSSGLPQRNWCLRRSWFHLHSDDSDTSEYRGHRYTLISRWCCW